jgi:hypothetical protein
VVGCSVRLINHIPLLATALKTSERELFYLRCVILLKSTYCFHFLKLHPFKLLHYGPVLTLNSIDHKGIDCSYRSGNGSFVSKEKCHKRVFMEAN